ncbi:hypothetical protein C6A86_009925 [Mycobacterium sp. ITM-2016-00316]|uniref:hypothetical protein n=1 Tax=Mycobacterium sp. ITM-2016-00316 TaxID=2099695 RepID=UPI00115C4147|nr:hypothetical protein [Mycobacterium sp. ITM-2016-00316]WNG83929.1 hypothetical protein C6A86_009925 [Mycobacterium sp. ITM-2016-00316]
MGWGAVTGGVKTFPAVVSTDFWRALRDPFTWTLSSGLGCSATVLAAEAGADGVADTTGAVPKIAAVRAMTPTVTKLVVCISTCLSGSGSHPALRLRRPRVVILLFAHHAFDNVFGAEERNLIVFQRVSGENQPSVV